MKERQIMEGRKERRQRGQIRSRGFVLKWPDGQWLPHCDRGYRKKGKLWKQDGEVNNGSVETKLHGGHVGTDVKYIFILSSMEAYAPRGYKEELRPRYANS